METVAAEGMAQDAESAGRIAELSGNFGRGLLVEEVGTQGFVLALSGGCWKKRWQCHQCAYRHGRFCATCGVKVGDWPQVL